MNGQAVAIASGANIARAPEGAYLHKAFIADKAPKGAGSSSAGGSSSGAGSSSAGGKAAVSGGNGNKERAVAAFFQAPGAAPTDSQSSTNANAKSVAGRLAVYGDSNCLDSSHTSTPCFPFMANVLEFLTENVLDTGLVSLFLCSYEPCD